MYELAISTTIFTSMLESAAAEQSSRMNAMEVRGVRWRADPNPIGMGLP